MRDLREIVAANDEAAQYELNEKPIVSREKILETVLYDLVHKMTTGGGIHGNPYMYNEVRSAIDVLTHGKSKYDLPKPGAPCV